MIYVALLRYQNHSVLLIVICEKYWQFKAVYFYFHLSCWWKSCNGNKIRGNCRIETRFGRLYSACSIYTGITYTIKLLIHVLFYSEALSFPLWSVHRSNKKEMPGWQVLYFYNMPCVEEETSANIASAEFPICALLLRKTLILLPWFWSLWIHLIWLLGEGRSK